MECQVVSTFCFTVEVIHHQKKSDNHCFRNKLYCKRPDDRESRRGKKRKERNDRKDVRKREIQLSLGGRSYPFSLQLS